MCWGRGLGEGPCIVALMQFSREDEDGTRGRSTACPVLGLHITLLLGPCLPSVAMAREPPAPPIRFPIETALWIGSGLLSGCCSVLSNITILVAIIEPGLTLRPEVARLTTAPDSIRPPATIFSQPLTVIERLSN